MKKRIVSVILSLVMLLSLLPVTALAVTDYAVWINGEQLTSAKTVISDGNEGTATLDTTTNPYTLTLNNVDLRNYNTSTPNTAIRTEVDLKIVIVGDCSLDLCRGDASDGIVALGNLTITGSGKLTVYIRDDGDCISLPTAGKTLTVDMDGDLFLKMSPDNAGSCISAVGNVLFKGSGAINLLNYKGNTVTLTGAESKLLLEGAATPITFRASNGSPVYNTATGSRMTPGGTHAEYYVPDGYGEVYTLPGYGIYANGKEFNRFVTSIPCGSGTATLDTTTTPYTLTLDGATITDAHQENGHSGAIYTKQPLKIFVKTDSAITLPWDMPADGIYSDRGDVTITGDGNLSIAVGVNSCFGMQLNGAELESDMGGKALTITSSYSGINAISITLKDTVFTAYNGQPALYAQYGVNVSGGSLKIDTDGGGIESSSGGVNISDCTISIESGGDGIAGESPINFTNCNTTIIGGGNGIKAKNGSVTFSGSGSANITSTSSWEDVVLLDYDSNYLIIREKVSPVTLTASGSGAAVKRYYGDSKLVSYPDGSYTVTGSPTGKTVTYKHKPIITVKKAQTGTPATAAENPIYGTAETSKQLFTFTPEFFDATPTLHVEWKHVDGGTTTWNTTAPTEGLVLTDDGKVSTTAATPAGSYTFRVTNGESVSSGEQTLTVEKAAPTLSMLQFTPPENLTYDGNTKTPTVTASGIDGLGEITLHYKKGDSAVNSVVDAGDYTVSASLAVGTNYAATDTDLTNESWKFTIQKANPTASEISVTLPENAVYDGTGKAANAAPKTGVTGLGNITVKYSKDGGSTYLYDAPVNAGRYKVAVSLAEGTNYNAAENLFDDSWTFDIQKATYGVTAPTAKDPLTYSGEPQALVNAGNCEDGTMEYALGENTTTAPTGNWSTNVPTGTDAGTYYVWYRVPGTNDFNGVSAVCVEADIAKAAITPTVSLAGWTYGQTANNPSVTGNSGSGAVSYSYKVKDVGDDTYSPTKPSNAGEYTVKAEIAATGNYESGSAETNFTITKATPTADLFTFTAPENLTYDGNSKTAAVEFSASGLSGLGEITVKYSNDGGSTYSSETPVSAGTYSVAVSVAAGTNYNAVETLTDSNWTFTIDKAVPTADLFTFTPPEDLTYDGNSKSAKIEVVDGVVGLGNVTLSYQKNGGPAADTKNVGTYKVYVSVAEGNNYAATATALSDESWTFTIAPKEIIITPDANQKKTYGDSDPVLTYTNTALCGSDELSGALGRMSGEAYSEDGYAFALGTLAAGDNYALQLAESAPVFMIEKKPVTLSDVVIADKTYDGRTDGVSISSYTLTGKKDGDELTVTGVTGNYVSADVSDTRTVNLNESAAWTLGGAAKDNYELAAEGQATVTTGKITKTPLTVTAKNKSIACGDDAANGGVEYSGFVNDETESVLSGTPTYAYYAADMTVPYSAGSPTGSYCIVPGGLSSDNYEITFVNGVLTVSAKQIDKPVAVDKTYTYTGEEQTFALNGFDENTMTLTGDKQTNANRYTVTVTPRESYAWSTDGECAFTWVIGKAPVTVKANSANLYVGDSFEGGVAEIGATIEGLFKDDSVSEYGLSCEVPFDDSFKLTTAGTYDIVVTVELDAAGDNYTVTGENGTLTVNKRSSSSGGGTPAPKPTEIPAANESGNSVKVEATVSGSTATVKEISASEISKAGTDTVSMDFSGLDKAVKEVKLPTSTVEMIANSASSGLEIKLSAGTVAFDTAALAAISEAAGGKDIALHVETVDVKTLSAAQKSAVAGLGNAVIIEATLSSDGKTISDFGSGSAAITVPYEMKGANKVAVVYYLDGAGKLTRMNTAYDAAAKSITFTAPHFSLYVLAEVDALPFVDADEHEYYADAVRWAVSNGITNGTSDTTFSPNAPVTRAQVVTFLWRAASKPVVDYAMNMSDVVSGEYYTEAVRWALSEGITKGTTDTAFSPEDVCTRGQIVTFLARFAGIEDADTESVFTDVPATEFFAAAVKWAKDNKVTDGMTATTFEPYVNCDRAQVVTFLYRWMVK